MRQILPNFLLKITFQSPKQQSHNTKKREKQATDELVPTADTHAEKLRVNKEDLHKEVVFIDNRKIKVVIPELGKTTAKLQQIVAIGMS